MIKTLLVPISSIILISILSSLQVTQALDNDHTKLEKIGVSIDLYRQKLDLKVTDVKANNISGITPEMLNSVKSKLDTTNGIDVYGLRLDYQVTPTVNIFGSLGKVEEKTTVAFSNVNPAISDLGLEKQGMVYSVGATYSKYFDTIYTSVSLIHSRIDLDDNPHDITVSGLIPTVGIKTRIGLLTGSLLYQEVDAVFTGEIAAPFVGAVPVEVSATNDNDIQALVGLRTRLARNFYLNASAGLNGQENYQVQLNKRF